MNRLAAIPHYWPLTCLRWREAEGQTRVLGWKNQASSFSVMPREYPWLNPPAASSGSRVPAPQGCARNTSQVPGACLWGAPFAGLPANTSKAESAHDPLCFKRANNLSKGWKPFIFLFSPLLSHLLFLFPCCFFRFRPFVSSLLDICPLPGLLLRAAKGHRHHLPYSTLW